MKSVAKNVAIGGVGFGLGALLGTQLTNATLWITLRHHISVIEQCSVLDVTLGVALTPVCIAIRGKQSVWVWLRDNDIEMFSNITDWTAEDGTPMTGIEFARSGWNEFQIVAGVETATFPLATEFPAIGYWGIDFVR